MKLLNELKLDRSLDIKMFFYFVFMEIENYYVLLYFGYKWFLFFFIEEN